MIDLLLVWPAPLHIHGLAKSWNSTHLFLIYSYLREKGLNVRVFDTVSEIGLPSNHSNYSERLAQALAKLEFKVAGVSCWSCFQYLASMEVGRALRRLKPDTPIVVGGWHATALPEDFEKDDSPFDLVVRGPGEKVLLEICRDPKRTSPRKRIWGEPAPLDEITWDWSYPHAGGSIILSRGCPHSCLFCFDHPSGKGGCSLDHALKQYDEARRHVDEFVLIYDACFGVNTKWRRDFLKELAQYKDGPRPSVELRSDQLELEDVRLLAKARALVYFGFETGSQKMLTIMQKTSNPRNYTERFLRTIDQCDSEGVTYLVGTLFNHPGETRDTVSESLDFFDRIVSEKARLGLVTVVDHTFAYYPGSRFDDVMTQFARNYGTRIHFPDYWRHPADDHRAQSKAVTASHGLSHLEAKKLIRRINAITFKQKISMARLSKTASDRSVGQS